VKRAKRLAYRRMVETRRLYRFENHAARYLPSECVRLRAIGELRLLAQIAWRKHGRKGLPCPEVIAGKGTPMSGHWYSYTLGYSRIVLSRAQRSILVLLHELTHATGHGGHDGGHGRGFLRKYIELLCDYGMCNRDELRLGLSLFGIRA
jgi:hypothetical protein